MIKMEIECKSCGMIYTLKQGVLPLGIKCMCNKSNLKIKEPKTIVSQLKAR